MVAGSTVLTDVFVHSHGLCESHDVGAGTRIWAFAHVLEGARIGRDCNICDNVFVEGDVVIGDGVTIKSGVQLWNGVRLGDRVFVGPNATFTNDQFPQSKTPPRRFLETVVEDGASIGANATILPGLRIGRSAMVGAGAVVTKSVPADAIVVGNPARIVGYRSAAGSAGSAVSTTPREPLGVGGCEVWRLRHFQDLRGDIAPLEFESDLPFVPRRSFVVYAVPTSKVRGEHAHRICHQFLVAVHGHLSVIVDDGIRKSEIELTAPTVGLWLPPMVWGTQHNFHPDTALLVMASHPYDPGDYIRDYGSFIDLVTKRSRSVASDGP